MKTAYCFDLDGTVTRDEILPLLSQEIGLYEEMSALTEATIKGLIPFRKSFLLRCRLLNEIPISRVQEIIAKVSLHETLAAFIRDHRDNCFIITGNLDVWVKPLEQLFGCTFHYSTATVANDRLVSVDHVLNKGDAVKRIRENFERIVAVGDGMGDVPMFEEADVRIAFGGTHPPIQSLIQFTDYVTFSEKALCNLLSMQ
ncbi:MAG: Phosphoserine phosphatase SerB2 [Verrucomicrobiae bacterium]|nr:Phosphoserine phosphatase SerB2 [Verrucomicrobiae bacterium]